MVGILTLCPKGRGFYSGLDQSLSYWYRLTYRFFSHSTTSSHWTTFTEDLLERLSRSSGRYYGSFRQVSLNKVVTVRRCFSRRPFTTVGLRPLRRVCHLRLKTPSTYERPQSPTSSTHDLFGDIVSSTHVSFVAHEVSDPRSPDTYNILVPDLFGRRKVLDRLLCDYTRAPTPPPPPPPSISSPSLPPSPTPSSPLPQPPNPPSQPPTPLPHLHPTLGKEDVPERSREMTVLNYDTVDRFFYGFP